MPEIVIYTTASCPYCLRAKALLDRKGVAYQEIRVDTDPQQMQEMLQRSQRRTVPQIFIGGRHVGGCDDLHALEQARELDALLGLGA